MKKTTVPHPWFWYIYRLINFSHSFNATHRDREKNIEITLKLRGQKKLRKNPFLRAISWALWLSPALLVIILAFIFPILTPWNYIFAIIWVTVYHFAAMYYIIEVWDILKIECYQLDDIWGNKKWLKWEVKMKKI